MALKASGLNGVRLSLIGVAATVSAGGVFTRMGAMGSICGVAAIGAVVEAAALRLLSGTFTALGVLVMSGVVLVASAVGCGAKIKGVAGTVVGASGAFELAAKALNKFESVSGTLFELAV